MSTINGPAVYDELPGFLTEQVYLNRLLAFRLSERTQFRLDHLLDKQRKSTFTHAASAQLDDLSFSDGKVAELDFRGRISGRGGAIAPLGNIAFFAQVNVAPVVGTQTWPNGVDSCPDVLDAEATDKAIAELGSDLEVS